MVKTRQSKATTRRNPRRGCRDIAKIDKLSNNATALSGKEPGAKRSRGKKKVKDGRYRRAAELLWTTKGMDCVLTTTDAMRAAAFAEDDIADTELQKQIERRADALEETADLVACNWPKKLAMERAGFTEDEIVDKKLGKQIERRANVLREELEERIKKRLEQVTTVPAEIFIDTPEDKVTTMAETRQRRTTTRRNPRRGCRDTPKIATTTPPFGGRETPKIATTAPPVFGHRETPKISAPSFSNGKATRVTPQQPRTRNSKRKQNGSTNNSPLNCSETTATQPRPTKIRKKDGSKKQIVEAYEKKIAEIDEFWEKKFRKFWDEKYKPLLEDNNNLRKQIKDDASLICEKNLTIRQLKDCWGNCDPYTIRKSLQLSYIAKEESVDEYKFWESQHGVLDCLPYERKLQIRVLQSDSRIDLAKEMGIYPVKKYFHPSEYSSELTSEDVDHCFTGMLLRKSVMKQIEDFSNELDFAMALELDNEDGAKKMVELILERLIESNSLLIDVRLKVEELWSFDLCEGFFDEGEKNIYPNVAREAFETAFAVIVCCDKRREWIRKGHDNQDQLCKDVCEWTSKVMEKILWFHDKELGFIDPYTRKSLQLEFEITCRDWSVEMMFKGLESVPKVSFYSDKNNLGKGRILDEVEDDSDSSISNKSEGTSEDDVASNAFLNSPLPSKKLLYGMGRMLDNVEDDEVKDESEIKAMEAYIAKHNVSHLSM